VAVAARRAEQVVEASGPGRRTDEASRQVEQRERQGEREPQAVRERRAASPQDAALLQDEREHRVASPQDAALLQAVRERRAASPRVELEFEAAAMPGRPSAVAWFLAEPVCVVAQESAAWPAPAPSGPVPSELLPVPSEQVPWEPGHAPAPGLESQLAAEAELAARRGRPS